MHEFIAGLVLLHSQFLSDAADSVNNETFKTTLLIVAGGVISSAIAAVAIIYPKRATATPVPTEDASTTVKELRRRAIKAESECKTANETIDRLETQFWERGINPHTNRPIGDSSKPPDG